MYKDIEQVRGRPLLVYATDFLSKNVDQSGASIGIELVDVEAFTDFGLNIKLADEKLNSLLWEIYHCRGSLE